ncbi:hypothetical protein M8C13_07470 [Crossiella sp. SN42]|uniref:hypothetical protein n=1 Tax=Crossiella sp. SN42 TaxID=2944808 RepID=UPI00207D4B4A|nr:hypothetical protein [Crossiella sp. SN42]MCO1575596.1 hypothetical protein [Crossiella sp. SN42]
MIDQLTIAAVDNTADATAYLRWLSGAPSPGWRELVPATVWANRLDDTHCEVMAYIRELDEAALIYNVLRHEELADPTGVLARTRTLHAACWSASAELLANRDDTRIGITPGHPVTLRRNALGEDGCRGLLTESWTLLGLPPEQRDAAAEAAATIRTD